MLAITSNSDDILFAGTPHGLFRSPDSGETWLFIDGPFADSAISAIVLDRASSLVLVATASDGVFKSTDGGKTWTEANSGLEDLSVVALLYGVDGMGREGLYAGTRRGVFRSWNRGATWVPASGGLPRLRITAMGSTSGGVYAGTQTGRLFKTTDSGASWSEERSVPWNGAVRVIGRTLSSEFVGAESGLFVKDSRATRWASASNGLSSLDVTSFAADPTTAARLYAVTPDGLYKSEDSGDYWSLVNDVSPSAVAIGLTSIFAAVDEFVWKSTDAGKSWKKVPLRHPATP